MPEPYFIYGHISMAQFQALAYQAHYDMSTLFQAQS
jgi:hypothetical protein